MRRSSRKAFRRPLRKKYKLLTDRESNMKNREKIGNILEFIMIFSFIFGLCMAECLPALFGCWAVSFGTYFIYHKIC